MSRRRIPTYTIQGQVISIGEQVSVEDIRLIVNETQKVVICSSMQKENVRTDHDTIEVVPSVCVLQPTDQLTIEIDKGESDAGSCDLLVDFFEVTPDTSEEIITDEEITQELEDIFNTIFN